MKISHFSSFSSIIANATSFKRYKSCIYKCLQTQAHEIEPSIYILYGMELSSMMIYLSNKRCAMYILPGFPASAIPGCERDSVRSAGPSGRVRKPAGHRNP